MLHSTILRLAVCVPSAFVMAAAAAAGAAAAAEAPPTCAGARSVPAPGSLEASAAAVGCQINRLRARRNLPRLADDARLAAAGTRHARQMVRRRFFSHVTPRGGTMTDRLWSAGYIPGDARWAVGETLAWGTYQRAAAAAVVGAWMRSPAHRDVLLRRRYRELGVGVAIGIPLGTGHGPGATYAAEFGVIER